MSDETPGLTDVPDHLIDKYLVNYRGFRKGITKEEMVEHYTQLSQSYEDALSSDTYHGPRFAADWLSKYIDENAKANVRVIDVAAGTGRVGEELYKLGFRNLDALDPCRAMLDKAKDKKVYRNVICDTIGSHRTEFNDDSYDCAVSCGGFGEGHIPVAGLSEIARIIKPGGYIVLMMRSEYLDYVEEYIECLLPRMEAMQKEGAWEIIEDTIVKDYCFEKNGRVFVFKIVG